MFYEDLNISVMTGNLTRDVELRYAPSGTAVGNLRIGVNGRRKAGEEWVDKANYFDIICFGKDAENAAKYLKRGRRILVEARPDWSEWEDKEGNKRQGVKFIARRILYLTSGKHSDEEQTAVEQTSSEERFSTAVEDFAAVGAEGGGEDDIQF